MERRFKVRFPGRESFFAAQAVESADTRVLVRNEKRATISIDLPPEKQDVNAFETALDTHLQTLEQQFGAQVVEDFHFHLEQSGADIFTPQQFGPDVPNSPSLDDVLTLIGARDVWAEVDGGRGVTIAVVDTGIDGTRPEFPDWKRAGSWQADGDTPWTDWDGHGTMCACIAAGTRIAGGDFDGVAPNARLIACKTRFFDSELTAIYDFLSEEAQKGVPIIATNSFGLRTGTPPPPPDDIDFPDALSDAIAAGVFAFFSAGNYHDLAGGLPDECGPTSIWLHKCRSDVLTVATCDLERQMWFYSSRGPGQFAGQPGTSAKPDVTAPTPRNGRVVYGNAVRSLPDGWGTSGACPQAAGLGALLLAKNAGLSHPQLFEAIRAGAVPLGHGPKCEGAGLLSCTASFGRV